MKLIKSIIMLYVFALSFAAIANDNDKSNSTLNIYQNAATLSQESHFDTNDKIMLPDFYIDDSLFFDINSNLQKYVIKEPKPYDINRLNKEPIITLINNQKYEFKNYDGQFIYLKQIGKDNIKMFNKNEMHPLSFKDVNLFNQPTVDITLTEPSILNYQYSFTGLSWKPKYYVFVDFENRKADFNFLIQIDNNTDINLQADNLNLFENYLSFHRSSPQPAQQRLSAMSESVQSDAMAVVKTGESYTAGSKTISIENTHIEKNGQTNIQHKTLNDIEHYYSFSLNIHSDNDFTKNPNYYLNIPFNEKNSDLFNLPNGEFNIIETTNNTILNTQMNRQSDSDFKIHLNQYKPIQFDFRFKNTETLSAIEINSFNKKLYNKSTPRTAEINITQIKPTLKQNKLKNNEKLKFNTPQFTFITKRKITENDIENFKEHLTPKLKNLKPTYNDRDTYILHDIMHTEFEIMFKDIIIKELPINKVPEKLFFFTFEQETMYSVGSH